MAAVWEHRDHTDTVAYCAPDAIDQMHKVVLEVRPAPPPTWRRREAASSWMKITKLWAEEGEQDASGVPRDAWATGKRGGAVVQGDNLAKGDVVSEIASE